MDRLRHLILPAALFFIAGCKSEPEPEGPAPSRFAAVKTEGSASAGARFCERSFPATGSGTRRWVAPPDRPVPGAKPETTAPNPGWTWVNLWASWCQPCVHEMPLLGRWTKTLRSEGVPVELELWSIDESEEDLRGALTRELPGRVRWLRSAPDLAGFLESLGIERDSAIPIHALVDRAGMIRCVRVGSVGEESYGAVKALLEPARP